MDTFVLRWERSHSRDRPTCGTNSQYGVPTNALGNAPAAGAWFPELFQQLVRNASPVL